WFEDLTHLFPHFPGRRSRFDDARSFPKFVEVHNPVVVVYRGWRFNPLAERECTRAVCRRFQQVVDLSEIHPAGDTVDDETPPAVRRCITNRPEDAAKSGCLVGTR